MGKSGKILGSRRKLCGRSPGSFKDHKRVRSFVWLAFKQRREDGSALAELCETEIRSGSLALTDSWGAVQYSLEVANAIKEGFTRGSNFALIRRIIQLFSQTQH
ncbi:hypothetical protein Golob_004259 [Gossypium lobatum]|uniref:Uncharacterized protein n=1 Tax=Gossypium lobatum TaxID=34289 RepID=A0A7J8N1E5_9ROSI|nr:hypothetical protein [Gossypium lobatum]